MTKLIKLLAIAGLVFSAVGVSAQQGNNPAAAACTGQAAGAACSFTGPGGQSVAGVCTAPQPGSAGLVCRPSSAGTGQRGMGGMGGGMGTSRMPR